MREMKGGSSSGGTRTDAHAHRQILQENLANDRCGPPNRSCRVSTATLQARRLVIDIKDAFCHSFVKRIAQLHHMAGHVTPVALRSLHPLHHCNAGCGLPSFRKRSLLGSSVKSRCLCNLDRSALESKWSNLNCNLVRAHHCHFPYSSAL